MGIAVYTLGGCCTEEVADSTLCHILNLYRRVSTLNESVKTGKKPQNAEQVRELADGCMRIRHRDRLIFSNLLKGLNLFKQKTIL